MKEGWEKKHLKNISKIMYGYTSKSSFEADGPKYLRITDIQNQKVNWNKVPNCKLTSENFEKYQLVNGDIVFARTGATTGKSYLFYEDIDSVFASYLIKVQLKAKKVLPVFLYKYFQSDEYWKYISLGTSGSAQGGFNAKKLSNLKIPIPPIEEQQQIVVILDKAFKKIDQAIANVEQNIQNAEDLFQSKLNQIFSQKDEGGVQSLPKGWEEKKLSEITEVKDGTHDSPKYLEEGIPFVTQKNIKDGELVLDNTKFISEEDHKKFYKRSNVKHNDILIAMIGANRGEVCQVKTKEIFSIKNVGLIKESPSFDSEYLVYCLRSGKTKKYIKDNSSGSAQGFIGLTKLRELPVKITEISVQRRITKNLTSLENEINKLKSNQSTKLKNLEDLKKSLLEKAFSGELTKNEVGVLN